MFRVLLILALSLQPWALVAGARSCGVVVEQAAVNPSSCCTVQACCSSAVKVERHHCGQRAELCRCGDSVPSAPQSPRPQSTSASELIAALLPRLLVGWAGMQEPRHPATVFSTEPAGSATALEQRALLCIWLT